MKNDKAFTLVELLAVIIILGVLAIILIPTINNSDKKTKEKMLLTKVETTGQALVVWAGSNRECFTRNATDNEECMLGLNKGCTKNENIIKCEVTYEDLAKYGIINYDTEEKDIINPVSKTSMKSEKVDLCYNTKTKTFGLGDDCSKVKTTTTTRSNIPELLVNPEKEEEWSKAKEIEITISGGSYNLEKTGKVKYGFSESKSVRPTSEEEYTYNVANEIKEKKYEVEINNVTGMYYLHLNPDVKTANEIELSSKITGPYYLDNTAPSAPTMSFVYGDFSSYNGEWTNQNIYAAQSVGKTDINKRGPSGSVDAHSGIGRYQISKDNTNWTNYNYDYTNELYKIAPLEGTSGEYTRYFRACDKVGNCGESISVVAKIDKVTPTVSIKAFKTGTNTEVGSNTWNDTGLDFKITKGSENNVSNYTIKYCKDTNNTCTPYISATNNQVISDYKTVTGEYYIRYQITSGANVSSEIGSYHAKIDVANPTVKVTGYKYNGSASNNVGDLVKNTSTYTSDGTFTISDSWVSYGATFKFETSALSGVKSIVWKWNASESTTDTGSSYPSANASTQTSPFETKYATLTAAGYRKGAWIVTGNNNKTTTITVVIKIDSCENPTYQNGSTCTKSCGSGTLNRLAYSRYSNVRCSAKDVSSGGSACNTQGCCASTEHYNCGSWTWSSCTKQCGGGTQYQYRTCSLRSAYDHSTSCSGTETETQSANTSCNTRNCCASTEHYNCGSWTWSSCTKQCGGGTQYQYRTCSLRSAYDHSTSCSGTETETQSANTSCNTRTCCSSKKIGSYGSWSGWGACNAPCGNILTGTQSRTRTIYYVSNYDGSSCGTDTETQTQSCLGGCCPSDRYNSAAHGVTYRAWMKICLKNMYNCNNAIEICCSRDGIMSGDGTFTCFM